MQSLSRLVTMKVLIVINCVIIVIIGFCDCEYVENNSKDIRRTITLLYSSNDDHNEINDQFYYSANKLGFGIQKVMLNESSVANTIAANKEHPNVINLKVSFKTIQEQNVNHTKHTSESDSLIWIYDCPNKTYCYANDFKIINENILNHKAIMNIIDAKEHFGTKPKILVCIPMPVKRYEVENVIPYMERDMSIEIEHCNKNTKVDNNLLAIIANTPVTTDSIVPAVFYQTPYEFPETKDYFPNSISLSTSWQPITHAFTSFLMRMEWYRVAIVSDESEYSEAFLEKLIPLFVKNRIIFNTQSCDNNQCNFYKALQTLRNGGARIVILNVDSARHAKNILKAIRTTKASSITWILRDWPFHEDQPPMNAYSITLHPIYNNHVSNSKPHLSALVESIRIIGEVYKKALGDYEVFRRRFLNMTKEVIQYQYNTIAQVTYHDFNGHVKNVADMTIRGSNVKFTHFKLPVAVASDVPQSCIARSSDYFIPCALKPILLLTVVLVVFALIIFIIIVYINGDRRRRYRRFH